MTLGDLLREAAHNTPDKPALICGKECLTYRELDDQATRCAYALRAEGIEKGDRVALHMTNTIPLAVAYFGCFRAGAIAVPVNARLKTEEIEYILQHSGAKLYIGETELYAQAEPTRRSCPDVRRYVVTDGRSDSAEWRAFCEPHPESAQTEELTVSENDVAAILYTSGTTARPKGVTHTQTSLRECARVTCQVGFESDDRLALFTPMTHASGLNCCLVPGVLAGMDECAGTEVRSQSRSAGDPPASLHGPCRPACCAPNACS